MHSRDECCFIFLFLLALPPSFCGFLVFKAHLKTASSTGNSVLVLANAQVMRNKTSVLEQIPTYEIVTNVLNNQLETPIARMKNSATPIIGGPAVHEFGVAYVIGCSYQKWYAMLGACFSAVSLSQRVLVVLWEGISL